MSAIQPMDVATPHPAIPVHVSAAPGGAEPAAPFAEVMRSAVTPSQMAQRASYPSSASASSRSQFNRSNRTSGTDSNRVNASVSNASSQAMTGRPSIPTGNPDGVSVASSVSATSSPADLNAAAASLVDGEAQSSITAADIGDRSSRGTTQPVRAAAETESSPAVDFRKPTSSAKETNRGQGASGFSAVATAPSIAVVSFPLIVTRASIVNLSRDPGVASSAADPISSKLKSVDGPPGRINSSISKAATAAAFAAHTSQEDGAAGSAGMLSHGAGISTDGIIGSHNPVPLHEGQIIDAHSNSSSKADATQNSNSSGDIGQNQSAVVGDGASTQPRANESAIVAGDPNSSNTVGVTGIGNLGAVGNDPVGSGGDRASTSVHGSDGLKDSGFTAAIPAVATAAKDLPASHANPADSDVGLQNSSSVFSGNHSSATGGFFSSTAISTAPRATTADAFTALDSAASGERGVLLHAAPHQVAVGVSDPSLGWVEVRAERVSGQIAAALTTTTAASHAALTSVLPTMATYLQDHHAGIQQVHVETSLAGGQAGTGSQGQTASQSDARTRPDQIAAANSASSAWNSAPVASAIIPANHGTNVFQQGHHFSIRA